MVHARIRGEGLVADAMFVAVILIRFAPGNASRVELVSQRVGIGKLRAGTKRLIAADADSGVAEAHDLSDDHAVAIGLMQGDLHGGGNGGSFAFSHAAVELGSCQLHDIYSMRESPQARQSAKDTSFGFWRAPSVSEG